MNIGICDFDFLSTKTLCNYNFGVLLVSSYYLKQGSKVRLIINLDYENLRNYDKIYMFKDYKTKIQPVNLIKDYYSLPVEEYGEGFQNRPLLPSLPNLIYTKVNTEVYKPIIFYMKSRDSHLKLDKKWSEQYFPTQVFFKNEDELLLREEPSKKKLLVYDDPALFFNTELGVKKMTEIIKRSIIKFVKPIRISIIPPEHWDTIFNSPHIVAHRERLCAAYDDPYFEEFLKWCRQDNVKNFKLVVKTESDGIQWLKKKGGNFYGNYGLKDNVKERLNGVASEEDISIRHEWFTTKRPNEYNRRSRERASETQRRKYLPSEYERRWKERRARKNAIRRGR